jgi:tetratricopeptide (TPR) repeat protein
MTITRNILFLTACLWGLNAWALDERGQQRLQDIQQRWAEARYALGATQREQAFEALGVRAEEALADNPDAPELLIWRGIVLASLAGEKGGLGALSLVKQARSSLEAALEKDPSALDGSAWTSLGSLYYQVPGWPLGFGNDKRAEEMLQKALAINPDGIDPNFFYGDYLLRARRYDEARAALLKARAATPRPGRELADEGRRREIDALLAQIDEKTTR